MGRIWTLIFGLSVMALTAFASYAEFPRSCKAFAPPIVHVNYESKPVRYDYSRTAEELSATKSDTVDPYGPNAHDQTEGLRADHPTIETKTSERVVTYPLQGLFCIGYNEIDVRILLKPVIYIASRWRPGRCRDAILGHEQKHVAVDHQVMNDFVPRLRAQIEATIKKIGTLGPLKLDEQDKTENSMTRTIETTVNTATDRLHAEITERQSHVDTLAEYQRVSKICAPER